MPFFLLFSLRQLFSLVFIFLIPFKTQPQYHFLQKALSDSRAVNYFASSAYHYVLATSLMTSFCLIFYLRSLYSPTNFKLLEGSDYISFNFFLSLQTQLSLSFNCVRYIFVAQVNGIKHRFVIKV